MNRLSIKDMVDYMKYLKVDQSILSFLEENPELLIRVGEDQMEVGRSYPDMNSWIDYHKILDKGNLWGDEESMILVAKHCLGIECAVMFPRFYLYEWSKRLKEGTRFE